MAYPRLHHRSFKLSEVTGPRTRGNRVKRHVANLGRAPGLRDPGIASKGTIYSDRLACSTCICVAVGGNTHGWEEVQTWAQVQLAAGYAAGHLEYHPLHLRAPVCLAEPDEIMHPAQ